MPLLICAALISSCTKKEENYLTVQMCVENQEGVSRFKKIMQDSANEENLQFLDSSLETGERLQVVGADKALHRDASLAVNVGIKGGGDTFVMGGNLGLPPYQIALGFGAGSNPKKAHQLSDRLIHQLSSEWDLKTLPPGHGVLPMSDCGSPPHSAP